MHKKYYLNDRRVDNQHEELFNIAEKFINNEIENYNSVIDILYKHTVTHFHNEEELMLLNVPDDLFESHQKDHDRIRNLVEDFKNADIKEEDQLTTLKEIITIIENHIIKYDMLIKDYL